MKRAHLAVLAGLLMITGCGSEDPETPAACLGGAEVYTAALESAPADVLLDGTTPIGECIVDGQEGGEIGVVAEALVTTATRLNTDARKHPSGASTVQLGYLIGAVQEAATETSGIHQDLVIRLDAAARFTERGETLPAPFERAFGEGYAAGQASG